jgi:hypothetical protein
VGLNGGASSTTLRFGSGELVTLEQVAVTATFEKRVTPKLTWQVAAGSLVGGRMGLADGSHHHTGFGPVLSGGVSYQVLDPKGFVPFVMLSGSASVSLLPSFAGLYTAVDVRAAVAAGYTFFERLTPYLTARAFGGPVFWRNDVGTDLFHFQLGAGVVLGLPWGLDVSAEVVPLGEQRVSLGVGAAF